MSFWDASAITPIVSTEPFSAAIISFSRLEKEPMTVWWGTAIECNSAISRLLRTSVMSLDQAEGARNLLDGIRTKWEEIIPSEEIRDKAIILLKKYALKAGDALQLAAALLWAGHKPSGKQFVCLDDRLREAAQLEGFNLFPEKM